MKTFKIQYHTPLLLLILQLFACGGDGSTNTSTKECDTDVAIDCTNPACSATTWCLEQSVQEHCYNGIDDDNNGQIDCQDAACNALFICQENIEDCANGKDDDGDSLIDCQDTACKNTSLCKANAENCATDEDEDGDSLVGCMDPDCSAVFGCLVTVEVPGNNEDDDGDGLTDCDDPDIARTHACLDGGEQCSNGKDEDGDGLVDCADVDCAYTSECLQSVEVCNNGSDEDGDGLIDCQDSACAGSAFCTQEYCVPGSGDEDGNGLADCEDPACQYVFSCLQDFTPDMCTRLMDGSPDCNDPDCSAEPMCQLGPEVCGDNIDNDGDGLTDCDDIEECLNLFDEQNSCLMTLCGDPANNYAISTYGMEGDIIIASPDDMTNNFPLDGGPTVLRGNLILTGDDTNFQVSSNSLRCILPMSSDVTETGNLIMAGDGPSTFIGMENLQIVHSLGISLTEAFADFSGLNNLQHVLGNININEQNLSSKPENIFTFNGLENLVRIGESINYSTLVTEGNLTPTRQFSFTGLSSLTHVGEHLLFLKENGGDPGEDGPCFWRDYSEEGSYDAYYARLEGMYFRTTGFGGLENLRHIGGDLCVAGNENVNFDGLGSLQVIGGDLLVGYHDALPAVGDADVTGEIEFKGLSALREIGGSLGSSVNENISDRGVAAAFIVNNFEGLENLTNIDEHFIVTQGIGHLNFENLQQLQSIGGHFIIRGLDESAATETTATGLENLTSIQGSLVLKNSYMVSLSGLENLTTLGGLELFENSKLSSIAALSNITELTTGNLWIGADHDALTSFDGLNNITYIEGNLHLQYVVPPIHETLVSLTTIQANMMLEGMEYADGFTNTWPNLMSLGGLVLNLSRFSDLTNIPFPNGIVAHDLGLITLAADVDLTALESVQEVQGNLNLYGLGHAEINFLSNINTLGGDLNIGQLQSITDFAGLRGFTTVGGSLIIQQLGKEDLAIVDHIEIIGEDLIIDGNDELNTLFTNTPDVRSVGRHLYIMNNNALVELDTLGPIGEISGLKIERNQILETLAGADNITAINGYIYIKDNPALTSFSGLDNLNLLSDIYLINNQALTTLNPIDMQNITFTTNTVVITDNIALDPCEFIIRLQDLGVTNITLENNQTQCI